MKAYKIEILVIDHDGVGEEEIKQVLENARYPNRCISPDVKTIKSVDIGEWHDDHQLNKLDSCATAYHTYFPE